MNALTHPGRIALLVLYMFPFLSVIFSLFSGPSSAWSGFIIIAFPGTTLLFLLLMCAVVGLRASRYYFAPLNGFLFLSLGSFLVDFGVLGNDYSTILVSDIGLGGLFWEILMIPIFFCTGIVLTIIITHIVHRSSIPKKYWKTLGMTLGGLVLVLFFWRYCLYTGVCIS